MRFVPHALLLTLLFSGCTSDSDSTVPDACKLLTPAEAEAALGGKVTAPNVKFFGGGAGQAAVSNCSYMLDSAETYASSSLLIRSFAEGEAAEEALERHIAGMREQFGADYKFDKVAGIGSGAVWDPALNQLTIFNKEAMYIYSIAGFPSEELLGRVTELVKRTFPKKG